MAVKVDRTMPVIFASSLNYKSINSEQTSPKDTSFKRHKYAIWMEEHRIILLMIYF